MKIEKVGPAEQHDIYFIRAFQKKAIIAQNHVLMLRHKKVEYKYMHILNELLESLCKFLLDDEGEVKPVRQMMVRDMGALDLVIAMLHYPLKIKKAYERPLDMVLTLRNTMELTYRALRLSIMEYRPNELYASQWLGLLIEDVFNDHSGVLEESSKTLKELYDNNKRVLETRIDMDTIFKFVFFLAENKQCKYFDFFDALIICNGSPIVGNQNRITRIILDDEILRNQLVVGLYLTKIGGVSLTFGQSHYYAGITIESFHEVSQRVDKLATYKFVVGSLKLFSNLCLGNNRIAIEGFKSLYPLKHCVKIITNERLEFDIRSAFAELAHRLWADSNSSHRFLKASRTKPWSIGDKSDKNYDVFLSIGAKAFENFLALFDFLEYYFEDMVSLLQFPKAIPLNLEFTMHNLELLRDLIRIRVVDDVAEIQQIKGRITALLFHDFGPFSGEGTDWAQASKVICLDLLKEFIFLEIDIEVETILHWIRKKSFEVLAKDIQNNEVQRLVRGETKEEKKKDKRQSVSNNGSGIEVSSLLSTMRMEGTIKLLTNQFQRFVDSCQLNYQLVEFLIRHSVYGTKTPLQTKSLELLLDLFSIGFYIEEYLEELLLVKEGEEGAAYERISDACSLLEKDRERYRSRVFTESEEYHLFIAMMNLLMSDLTKRLVSKNPFQSLLEDIRLEPILRLVLYTRFVKTYSKPTKIFQNLNESLSLVSTILEILRVDRLTFYELSHSTDQKLVIYNLLFEYLRIVCMDNPKVKAQIFVLMSKFIESIEPGGEIFMKYLCFFEEFAVDNLAILARPETVKVYTDTILGWICTDDTLFTCQSVFLLGMLPRLVTYQGKAIKDNQQIVLRAIFSSKHSAVLGLLRGQRLGVLLKGLAREVKEEYFEFEDAESFRLILVREPKVRVLGSYFAAIRGCIEKGNPLLRKFCQNLYPLEFFRQSLGHKLPLELRLSMLHLLEELFILDMDGRITVSFVIDELFDDALIGTFQESIHALESRRPSRPRTKLFLVTETGVCPLDHLHEEYLLLLLQIYTQALEGNG